MNGSACLAVARRGRRAVGGGEEGAMIVVDGRALAWRAAEAPRLVVPRLRALGLPAWFPRAAGLLALRALAFAAGVLAATAAWRP